MARQQPDYQISFQRPTQSIVIIILEIQLKRLLFLYPKEISLKKTVLVTMGPKCRMIYQRRCEFVRPSRHLKLKSNSTGLDQNINRDYVLSVFIFILIYFVKVV